MLEQRLAHLVPHPADGLLASDRGERPRVGEVAVQGGHRAPGLVDPVALDRRGEDDLSLESWRTQHRIYWERVSAARGAAWSEDDEIVFERFAVVWPPEHADPR